MHRHVGRIYIYIYIFVCVCVYVCVCVCVRVGLDSSVGIATRYGLDRPGIESQWGARFSAPVQSGPEDHPATYTMCTVSLSRG